MSRYTAGIEGMLAEAALSRDDLSRKAQKLTEERARIAQAEAADRGFQCFAFVGAFALKPFAIVWRAWVTTCIWEWLVAPAFHVGPLTLGSAICLMFALAWLWGRMPSNEQLGRPWTEILSRTVTFGIIYPAFALGEAWLIRKAFDLGYLEF